MNILKTDIENVDQIFHIADVHIRPYKRHEEYRQVFLKLYDSIIKRATKDSLILLAGDIVHSKTEMTPELIAIVSEFFIRISAICPTIVIPGNHDANLNNINRLDALTPIIDNLNLNGLHYIKKSGLYSFADLTFSHMSVFDDESKYIRADTFSALFKIALFHGIVDDAVNDFGYKLKNDKVHKSIFDGYDLVLLGDIHAYQLMTPTVAYCGSLIQQNFGESLKKGYLIWDIKTKESKFIDVENDYGYYTLEIRDNKIPDVSDIPAKCRMRLQVHDSNNEDTNKILTQVKQKYRPTEITVNRINQFIETTRGDVEIHNLSSVQYQNELIEKYLSDNFDLDKETIGVVCEINTELNKQVQMEDFIKNVRWRPVSFKWSNMFSYGEDNYVDFTNLKGIIGLFGPNATGKSAFVDALSFCLYDKASKDFLPINILNNRKDFFDCEFEFAILDRHYFIRRSIQKGKKGDASYKVDFWTFDESGIKKSMNGENRWGTNKNINNIVGTFDDFILTTFSMQEKNANFINIGHAKRKDLIIQFMGLGIFDKLNDQAKEELKSIKSIIKDLQKEDWDEQILKKTDELNRERVEYDTLITQHDEFLKQRREKEKQLSDLQKLIVKVDVSLDIDSLNEKKEKLIKMMATEKDYIDGLVDRVNKSQLEVSETRERWMHYFNMDIEKLYVDYKNLTASRKDLENDFEKLNIVLKGKYDKIAKLKEVTYDPNCTFCMNNALVKDAIKTKNEIATDEKRLLDLSNEMDTLDEIITSKSHIEQDYRNYKEIVAVMSEQQQESGDLTSELEKKNDYVASIEREILEVSDDIKKYEESKAAIENNKKLEKQILQLDTDSSIMDSQMKIIDRKKLSSYGRIQVLESNIEQCGKSKEKLHKKIIMSEYYGHYLECIKRDGIPYKIITNVVPALEMEINNILNQIVDFTISVVPDEKNINMLIVYDQSRMWPLDLASGMEKFISSIALRVALTNISSLPRPNFLIVDEGWGTLDSENLNSVSMMLDYLKTQFDFILIISHIDSIKEVANTMIEITRTDNFSSIVHK